jgi:hypothetical protein
VFSMSFLDGLRELLEQNGIAVSPNFKYQRSGGGSFSNPQQPTIPDAASLVKEVLEGKGIIKPAPEPMEIPPNMVTIFDGPHAGLYGLLRGYCSCGCSAMILTRNGIVEVSTGQFTKH